MHVLLRVTLAGLLGGLFCQCSATAGGTGRADRSPIQLQTADAVEVRYQHFPTGIDQRLRTANTPAPREADKPVYAKVVEADAMQALLGAMAAHGFFEHAQPVTSADARQARASLTLQINARAQVWLRRPADPTNVAELGAFNAALQEFLTLFNQTQSFQSAVGESGQQWIESVQRQAGAGRGK